MKDNVANPAGRFITAGPVRARFMAKPVSNLELEKDR